MKYLCHVPTETYGFISVELEGTAEEAATAYREVAEAMKPKPVNQIPNNQFNEIYDLVSMGKPIADDPGILEQMSPIQRTALNEAKKGFKRRRAAADTTVDKPN